jgi:hypothetical protein
MFAVFFVSLLLQLFYIIRLKCCSNLPIKSKKGKKVYYEQKVEDDDGQSVHILSQNFIWGRWFLCTGLVFTNQIIFSFIVESSPIDQV